MTKIVFFGNEQLAQGLEKSITPVFDAIIESGHEIAALVLPRRPQSRGHDNELKILNAAARHDVQVIFADEEADLDAILRQFDAEIGVLVAFGKIVKRSTIDVFPRGIVNIHPSLLPKYRGSTPLETAIVNGDRETGLSLMALSARMDAGAIYAQEKVNLTGTESKQELYEQLAHLGAQMIVKTLPQIVSGDLAPTPQDENAATYTKTLAKADGVLDPVAATAAECERKIRAYRGWPRTRLDFHGREVIITGAKVLDGFAGDDWPDIVLCADDTYLQILELVNPKSGKQMKTADYLRGIH
jgi:methionyl-tRNA formyltransferase